jgi:hypothetical protein
MDHETPSPKEQRFMEKGADLFVFEEGKKYRIPYHLIKKAVFSSLKKEDLIDIPHSARLQYKLMLLDPVIKAIVDFNELKISVIYNPTEADNHGAKMNVEQLTDFLAQEGVYVNQGSTKNEDYDYYQQFYSYAYSSPRIRKSAPYSYTLEEWKKLEPSFIKKSARADRDKLAKFRSWQNQYLKEKGEADMQSTKKPGFLASLFGLKK